VQVTVVAPLGKKEPDGGVQVTEAMPQLSEAAGAANVTVTPASPGLAVSFVTLLGHVSCGGEASRMIVTSSVEIPQSFRIDQRNVFAPAPSPVTGEPGESGLEMVPAPLTSVHTPAPITGTLPASVAVVEQTS
jgi:hypothetical protein